MPVLCLNNFYHGDQVRALYLGAEVGVTRQNKELMGRYQAIPFVKRETFDIDQHVVTKALDGLFYVVGQEGRKIRTDPAARVTDLLKEVFGK